VRVLNERATGRYTDLNLVQNPSRHLHRAVCEPSDLLSDRQSEGGLTDTLTVVRLLYGFQWVRTDLL